MDKTQNISKEDIYNDISTIVDRLKPISLDQIEAVKLMNRRDTKFVLGVHLLPSILEEISLNYSILEVNNHRIQQYQTSYFDTPDFKMYHLHQNGKLNRYKIRHRQYVLSKIGFFEIKFKSNKGKTLKKRIPFGIQPELNADSDEFIMQNSPFKPNQLETKMSNSFSRLTLINKETTERITIDYHLNLYDLKNSKNIELPYLTIIEVKRDGQATNSLFVKILKTYSVYTSNMSKYCIGSALLFTKLKQNRFKEKILNINKIKKEYNYVAS